MSKKDETKLKEAESQNKDYKTDLLYKHSLNKYLLST